MASFFLLIKISNIEKKNQFEKYIFPDDKEESFDDLFKKAKEKERALIRWTEWQNKKNIKFNQLKEIEKNDFLSSEDKLSACLRFLKDISEYNPFSDEDDKMRLYVKNQIKYWKHSIENTSIKVNESKTNRLYIHTKPQNAKIRILNIKPPFFQGISLLPCKYHVEVSAIGYNTLKQWVKLTAKEGKKDWNINYSLQKKILITEQSKKVSNSQYFSISKNNIELIKQKFKPMKNNYFSNISHLTFADPTTGSGLFQSETGKRINQELISFIEIVTKINPSLKHNEEGHILKDTDYNHNKIINVNRPF